MQKDKMLEALMNLGLTCLQAKSYLALSQFGEAEVRTISKASNVARQDIYRIMPVLEKLGLAEKVVATPVLYKATPLKDGVKMLLQEKTTQEAVLRKQIKRILSNKEENSSLPIQEDSIQFVIISERKLLLRRFQDSFLEAATCEMIFPGFAWNFVAFNLFESIGVAVAKDARIRIVSEQKDISPLVNRRLEALTKNPSFELRFACSPIDFGLTIFDEKEANMCISGNRSAVPCMWTNNAQFLKLAQMTFANEWSNAPENSNIQLKILNSRAPQF